ncbi:MAG: hypothetical protein R3250_13140, partial [Melioribacteraceae bacterium]|nr:hypothetical protein [Melioribacteraceae bacterium]
NKLKVSVDSISQKDLFDRAKQWMKENFISTEYDFLIQKDSVFAEHEGRVRFRNMYYPKGSVHKVEALPKIIPKIDRKINVDEENYKITLTAYNPLIFRGGRLPGTTMTEVVNPIVIYTVELSFFEGGYTIDPVKIYYCYLYEDQTHEILDEPDVLDYITEPYGKVYYRNLPFKVSHYKNKSGVLSPLSICLLSRIEIHFNDLNRSLYYYVMGHESSPDLYVYYPETNCRRGWRKW